MTFAVGDELNVGCSRVIVTAVVSPVEYAVTIVCGLEEFLIPDDPNGKVRLIEAAEWNWGTPTNVIPGYGHLADKELWGLANGKVIGPLVPSGIEGPDLGSVTIPFAALNVVLGLRYTAQIQTLYLTTQGVFAGSDQGKRKKLSGVTLRVDNTRGLLTGDSFDYLTPVPDFLGATSCALFTGDGRTLTYPNWDTKGEVCVQQTDPLPATVLGIIVEVTPGDTGH